jgi:hypothetical protein
MNYNVVEFKLGIFGIASVLEVLKKLPNKKFMVVEKKEFYFTESK